LAALQGRLLATHFGNYSNTLAPYKKTDKRPTRRDLCVLTVRDAQCICSAISLSFCSK